MKQLTSALEDERIFYARLGMAYRRLSCFEWDELMGEKPEGVDEMPNYSKPRLFGKRKPCKWDYVRPAVRLLREVCPMLDYWAAKYDPETSAQTPLQWFAAYAPDRMVSLLVQAGVIT